MEGSAIYFGRVEVCRYPDFPPPVAIRQWALDTGGSVVNSGDASFTTGGKPYSIVAALLEYGDGSKGVYSAHEVQASHEGLSIGEVVK